MNFRSSMEANFFRFVTECDPNVKLCEFEPHLFTCQDGLPKGVNYLPDFRLTYHDNSQSYVEVKGVLDARSKKLLKIMRTCRPDIKIYMFGQKEYEEVKKKYSRSIKGWE